MTTDDFVPRRVTWFVAALAVSSLAPPALAKVHRITATVEATVRELIGGQPASLDTSFDSYPETAPVLPMEAFAGLGDFTGDQDLLQGARSIAAFADPTLSTDPNPAEFGLELANYSRDASTSHESFAETIERRRISLDVSELGASAFAGTVDVTSYVFLSGAIVIWSDASQTDLTGLEATFAFTVSKNDAATNIDTNGPEVLFDTGLTLTGGPQGSVGTAPTGPIVALLGGPELLDLAGGSADAVAALNSLGEAHVVIIPEQTLPYTYPGTAGESFELVADVRCTAVNLPGGTGIAVGFGRELTLLAPALAEPLGPKMAGQVQEATNRAIQQADPRTIADDSTAGGPLCGLFGAETAFLGLMTFAGGLWRCRRRRLGR